MTSDACLVDFWVWLDMEIKRGQWFSFATLSADPTDRWSRVVLLSGDVWLAA